MSNANDLRGSNATEWGEDASGELFGPVIGLAAWGFSLLWGAGNTSMS